MTGNKVPPDGVLLWDLDGTLVDSRADIAASGNAARAAIGLAALPVDIVAGFVGDGVGKLLERLTPDADTAERATAQAAFELHYAAHCCDATVCYPGILEVFAELGGWTHAVVSNKPTAFSRRILDHVGLTSAVTMVLGGDVGPRKPAPATLLAAVAGCGGTIASSWMIGDHHTDLLAAEAADLRSIWCQWGIGQQGAGSPTAVASEAGDLPALIAGR